jgi:hypothetical protein
VALGEPLPAAEAIMKISLNQQIASGALRQSVADYQMNPLKAARDACLQSRSGVELRPPTQCSKNS